MGWEEEKLIIAIVLNLLMVIEYVGNGIVTYSPSLMCDALRYTADFISIIVAITAMEVHML
ncbi:MAG TPA: hypothetical protein ENI43_00140 [Firmicutes bacterium]|nr:hypothetical protein [Bacillota bacterium]